MNADEMRTLILKLPVGIRDGIRKTREILADKELLLTQKIPPEVSRELLAPIVDEFADAVTALKADFADLEQAIDDFASTIRRVGK